MPNNIILSVIVPIYNAENTLNDCLSSVLNNNIEIILINDGSTDKTEKICMEYCKKNKLIRYYYQDNKGPGAARNYGIDLAKGEYILFLDSDDMIDRNVLLSILNNELRQKPDILYYNFEQVNQNGKLIRIHKLDAFSNMSKRDLIINTLSWSLPWGQFKIVKSVLLKKNQIYFDEERRDCEELFFTIRCLEFAKKIEFTEKILYKYIKRYESLSNAININDMLKSRLKLIANLKKKFYDKYKEGVNNFAFVTYVQIYKLQSEKKQIGIKDYKLKKILEQKINEYLKMVDISYCEKRYQIIYRFFKYKLSSVIYLLFKLRRSLYRLTK